MMVKEQQLITMYTMVMHMIMHSWNGTAMTYGDGSYQGGTTDGSFGPLTS
jgi:hypothetical protein